MGEDKMAFIAGLDFSEHNSSQPKKRRKAPKELWFIVVDVVSTSHLGKHLICSERKGKEKLHFPLQSGIPCNFCLLELEKPRRERG